MCDRSVGGGRLTRTTQPSLPQVLQREPPPSTKGYTILSIFRNLRFPNPVVGYVTQSSASLALLDEPFWFCLKAQPKREHLGAMALWRQIHIECLSPRLRFRKITQRGPVWFVEAMFPGYLFAKFVYSRQHRAVESSHGIRGIVHFGDRWQPCRKILWSRFNREWVRKKS